MSFTIKKFEPSKPGRKAEEDKLQALCFSHWNKHFRKISLLFSVPNGVNLSLMDTGEEADKTRIMREMNKLKATGLTPGVSDLILLCPGAKAYFLEFKTKIGVQSPEQIKFESFVKELGFTYTVVRTFEDFTKLLTNVL